MQIKFKLNYLRITPRKTRQIADLIRGKMAEEAINILEFVARKPTIPILKLLKSAIDSAKKNFQIDSSNLYISKITVDEGPKLKRFLPVSRGMAHPLWKRTSHITLVLSEVKPTSKISKKEAEEKNIEKELEPEKKLEESNIVDSKKRIETLPKKEKIKYEKKESKKIKKPNIFKKIFRRKAF